jgi:hypothetical protein
MNIGILTDAVISAPAKIAMMQPICMDRFRPKYSADHMLNMHPKTPPIEYMQLITPMIELEYDEP